MGNFNRGGGRDRGGRDFGGGRDQGGRDFGRGRDSGGDFGRPTMHKVICSDCGSNCEVPFKPTGNKPVYCSDCFRKDDDFRSNNSRRGDRGRFDRPDRRDRRDRGGRGDFDRRDSRDSGFGEKKMHKVTCSDCGSSCEVPFKPKSDKPIYCSDCFGNNKANPNKDQFEELNVKLDKIIKELDILKAKKSFTIGKSVENVEDTTEIEKKTVTKKPVDKKATVKKKVEKKKVVKKAVAKKKVAKKK